MSSIDIITSLRDLGLSSVALWPVLMNWRSMVSYVPSLEQFISQNELLVSDAVRNFLASWYGILFGAAVCAAGFSYLGHTVWKSLRAIVLAHWHIKCSIPEDCAAYSQAFDWIKENPSFRDGTLFRASEKSSRKGLGDHGIDFGQDGMSSVDDIRRIKGGDIVSDLTSSQTFERACSAETKSVLITHSNFL